VEALTSLPKAVPFHGCKISISQTTGSATKFSSLVFQTLKSSIFRTTTSRLYLPKPFQSTPYKDFEIKLYFLNERESKK